jgi:hypothetical protein
MTRDGAHLKQVVNEACNIVKNCKMTNTFAKHVDEEDQYVGELTLNLKVLTQLCKITMKRVALGKMLGNNNNMWKLTLRDIETNCFWGGVLGKTLWESLIVYNLSLIVVICLLRYRSSYTYTHNIA